MNIADFLDDSKKIYAARIGNSFLVYPMSEDKFASTSKQQINNIAKKFTQEMARCLKNMPNVITCSKDMSSEISGYLFIKKGFTVEENVEGVSPCFFDNISFQVMWPLKNQEVMPWYFGDKVENFNIIYDGAIFLAYGEVLHIGHKAFSWHFGKEVIKIIKSCFKNSRLFKVITTGPIMLHPGIYFLFLGKSKLTQSLPTTIVDENDLYVLFPYESDANCEIMVNYFFKSTQYEVERFYRNELIRDEILTTEEEFRNKFETLPSLHQSLLQINAWNPTTLIKRYSYTRQLRDNIRECYQLYVKIMDLQAYINEQRRRYLSDISRHRFFAPLLNYFDEEQSDVGKTEFSPILQGIRFFEDETRMVMAGRSNLQAALIGALIASAIYVIASALLD